MKDFPEGIAIAGLPGPHLLDDLLFQAGKANRIGPVQLLRADRVVSEDHLRWAAMHAIRAFDEGRNQADRLEVEFLRYAAGRRQIKNAKAVLGLPDEPDDVIACALGERRLDTLPYFIDGLGLREREPHYGGMEALRALGVTELELEATTTGKELDLVLERVAMVDLMRK